jgi:hypothetical protein
VQPGFAERAANERALFDLGFHLFPHSLHPL